MSTHPKHVGVIDIGSNSIKLLIVDKDGAVFQHTLETRISKGITGNPPHLSEESIEAGAQAVRDLRKMASDHGAIDLKIVATSAVRDAENKTAFMDAVYEYIKEVPIILSGEQEAAYIGMGIQQDPSLEDIRDFLLADLGGGSMELLHFAQGELQQAMSLQLGGVRLTERHVEDATQPFTERHIDAIRMDVMSTLSTSGFQLPQTRSPLVLTGGAITHLRAALAKRQSIPFEESSSQIAVSSMHELLYELSVLSVEERIARTGLPANRADIMPTALVVLISVAKWARVTSIHHSLYNLRWGIAAEMLDAR